MNIEKEIIPSTWWEAGAALSGRNRNGFSYDVALHSGLKVPTEGSNAFRIRSGRQKVAEAAYEGSILGFGGVRVSEAERAVLKDISKALGRAP